MQTYQHSAAGRPERVALTDSYNMSIPHLRLGWDMLSLHGHMRDSSFIYNLKCDLHVSIDDEIYAKTVGNFYVVLIISTIQSYHLEVHG